MLELSKLGANLQYYRSHNHLTQSQLAEKLFVSFQAVSNWERGLTTPDLENLYHMACIFNVSIDQLLRGCEEGHEKYMIGIDGHARTEFVLFSESGMVVHRMALPPSNPSVVGMETTCKILKEGIDGCRKKVADIFGLFAGISGGTAGENRQKIALFLQENNANTFCFNDNELINLLASGNVPVNCIAMTLGTGSAVYVRTRRESRLFGGWGYQLDKTGSSYVIGREGICAALAYQDGFGEKTILAELFSSIFGVSLRSALDKIYNAGTSYIASLSSVVLNAYSLGDAVAIRIVHDSVHSLTSLLNYVQNKYPNCHDIVVGGELFDEYHRLLLPLVRKQARFHTNFIVPALPPVYGACVECCHRLNIAMGNSFIEMFTQSYTATLKNT